MSTIEVDKVIPQSGTSLQVGESGDTITIPAGATITNNGTATGFDTDTNDKVKVSSNDTTAGFLNGKLVAGTNISLTEGSDGGNETLTAAFSGTIGTSQIADSAVDLTSKVTGALPVANGGTNLTSGFANGITEADMWRLTTSITSNTNPISSNLERVDDASFSKIGTGMSVSSGYWSFPSTGLYEVTAVMNSTGASADNHIIRIHVTTDNSNYDPVSNVVSATVSSQHEQGSCFAFVNVTNTTNVKLFFEATSIGSGSIVGDTNQNYTCFKFIRLGDSQ